MQTRAAIPIFLRLKFLVLRIIGLCFTYQSILGPKGLNSNWGRYTESEFVFTFWYEGRHWTQWKSGGLKTVNSFLANISWNQETPDWKPIKVNLKSTNQKLKREVEILNMKKQNWEGKNLHPAIRIHRSQAGGIAWPLSQYPIAYYPCRLSIPRIC
jgi:hypothetical protein